MELWIILILSVIFSAFFSGMEIAFISSNKLIVELDKKKGLISGKIFSRFIRKPADFIAAMLIGNNIALVVYGIVISNLLSPHIRQLLPETLNVDAIELIIQTIISTLIILIIAEFLPKSVFRINPNYMMHVFAIPLFIIYYLLFPLIALASGASKLFWKANKITIAKKEHVFTRYDLDHYLKEFKHENIEEEKELDPNIQMFQNAIDFSNVRIRECMVPRPEICAVNVTESLKKLIELFIDSGFSKILVFKESIDNVIGYVHSFDVFKNPTSISEILRPVLIIPETMHASRLLTDFIEKNKNIAVVVDEFGGTSGVVTIEDVIEEIFGEIEDEYDTDDFVEKVISDREYIFSGRLEIDYLNEKYHLKIPVAEEYETLAGFVLHHYENIPQEKEIIEIDPFHFEIIKVSNTRIEQIQVTINEK